jgi:hypothetical protein
MTQHRKNPLEDPDVPDFDNPQWLDEAIHAYFDDDEEIPSPSEVPDDAGRLAALSRQAAQSAHALCLLRSTVAKFLDSTHTLNEALSAAAREAGVDVEIVKRWLRPRDPRPEALEVLLQDVATFARLAIALEVPLPAAIRLLREASVPVPVVVPRYGAGSTDHPDALVHSDQEREAILRAHYRENEDQF